MNQNDKLVASFIRSAGLDESELPAFDPRVVAMEAAALAVAAGDVANVDEYLPPNRTSFELGLARGLAWGMAAQIDAGSLP